mgnify:FL=1
MPFCGLDVHKRVVEAVVLNDAGKVTKRARFACERSELVRFAKRLGPRCRVALEATTNTWAVVALLQPLVAEVVVSNPMRTRAIAEAKIKTDKVDALVLAQLLRTDFLPRVWQPDDDTRRRRHLTSRRASLVGDRTRIKNRIHAVLHQRLIAPPTEQLFGKVGRTWLRTLELDDDGRTAIDSELALLAAVDAEIDAADLALARDAYADPRVRLLMTMPGFDVAVAQAVVAALGDVERFKSGDKAASYLGLVPSTRQTADHCYHGPITKQGRSHARWMLVQAAQHIGRHPGPLGHFFRRLAKKKNRNVAVVATARKPAVIAWNMLKRNEPYRYATPAATQYKLSKLRVRATGERRRSGTPKGEPRTKSYGTRTPTRRIPSLDEVLVSEDLPERAPLANGELRMLRRTKTTSLLNKISRPHRVPKKVAAKPTKPPANEE